MNLFLSLRRSYKLILFLVGVVLFFFAYNTFLVDHSLINLKIALAEAAEASTINDFQKLKAVFKIPILNEIASKDVSGRGFLSLELADNLTNSDNIDAAKNINFYLKETIRVKEAQRPRVLSFFDNLSVFFFKPTIKIPENKIKTRIKVIQSQIRTTQSTALLQELHYELANSYLQLGDYVSAQNELLTVINIGPAAKISFKSRFNLGWIYKATGETQKAIDCFTALAQEFSEKDSDFAITCQYQIADALYKKGDFLGARNLYAKLANNYSGFKAMDFGLLEAGNISLYSLGDLKLAVAFLEAFGLYQKGKDFSGILKDAVRVIEESEKPAELVKEATSVKKQEVKEGKNLSASLLNSLTAAGLRKKGFELLRNGKYLEAVDTFKKVLEILPRDGLSYSGLSLGYYWLKEDKRALEEAGMASELAPANELIAVNTMFILIKAKKAQEAVLVAQRLLAQRSTIKRAEFYYNLGYAYVMLNKFQEAVTYFRYAIRLNKELIFAVNNLGAILWAQRKTEEAVKMIKEAVAFSPGYADAHFNLGAIYFNIGRMTEAYYEFQLTLDIDPGYAEAKLYMDKVNKYLSSR